MELISISNKKKASLINKILVLSVFFNFLFYQSSLVAQEKGKSKPNIILILVDDLGHHDVSYYGTSDIRTPNIDKLCKAGMRFDNFYANSCVCSPTRASLLSGRYPEMVGVPGLVRSVPKDNFGFMKPDVVLLPKYLKSANYNTALVGKWNLGLESPNLPNEKGFDFFHGFLDDMMDDYYSHLRRGINFMRKNVEEINPKGHATDFFTDSARDYINSQKNVKSPFFLYLAYNAPHAPIQPPAEWLTKVKQRDQSLSDKRAKLVASIEHLDDGIGKVIETLKLTGKFENSLIIFLSDNGGKLEDGANNGNIRDGKGSMYEGGLKIPAFFVWENSIPAGSNSNQKALTMDIFPTICEVIGNKSQPKFDGLSLLPILHMTRPKLPERTIFFSRREGNMLYGGQTIQAVVDGNWKLLQNTPYQPYELYNLEDDPLERNNLKEANKIEHNRLLSLMMEHIQKGGSVPWQKKIE